MSRKKGFTFEAIAQRCLEANGLIHIASNLIVEGGEIDLLMQASTSIHDHVDTGEVCIVEVKGRSTISDWNSETVSMQKSLRWRRAAEYIWWRIEVGDLGVPLPVAGVQFVLVTIENETVHVTWNAMD